MLLPSLTSAVPTNPYARGHIGCRDSDVDSDFGVADWQPEEGAAPQPPKEKDPLRGDLAAAQALRAARASRAARDPPR
eukprot:9476486-Pyramimonas_sp.AAC.1